MLCTTGFNDALCFVGPSQTGAVKTMDIITDETLNELLEPGGVPAVSIYLPTDPSTGGEQDRVRLKNLIQDAHAEAVAIGHGAADVEETLNPLTRLVDDRAWWAHRGDGLAVFARPGTVRSYRFPISFESMVVVAPRFQIAPLIPVLSRGERFHVLAFSQKQVRLLSATRFEVGDMELDPEMPTSLDEALRFDDPEQQLQLHRASSPGAGLSARFHGHGGRKDARDERRRKFYRAVDHGIRSAVDQNVPLVLAGVADGVTAFRSVSAHPNIMDGTISGNSDHLSAEQLHRAAWPLVQDWFATEQSDAAFAFEESTGPTSGTVGELERFAPEGRVATLFITQNAIWHGISDHRNPGDRQVIEDVIVEVWTHGGTIHVMDPVPGGGQIAAILRY